MIHFKRQFTWTDGKIDHYNLYNGSIPKTAQIVMESGTISDV